MVGGSLLFAPETRTPVLPSAQKQQRRKRVTENHGPGKGGVAMPCRQWLWSFFDQEWGWP